MEKPLEVIRGNVLLSLGHEVTALDFSEAMLGVAAPNMPARGEPASSWRMQSGRRNSTKPMTR